MSLLTVAWKSIRQRALASSLTSLSVALGVMLMVAVLVIYGIIGDMFSQRSIGYDLIVGRKGSDLQLVLNTVYRLKQPIENLPYRYYLQLQEDPRVEHAIPFCLGDYTEQGGFPIIGTTEKYFHLPYAPGRTFKVRGEPFGRTFDALIGSRVAEVNGWDIGTKFKLVHGGAESDHVHDEQFTVVGVLQKTGTPNDKSVFIYIDGFYQIAGHETSLADARRWEEEFFGNDRPPEPPGLDEMIAEEESHAEGGHHHHHHEIPDVQKQVTAVLLKMKRAEDAGPDSPCLICPIFAGELKKGYKAQAVNPVIVMNTLMTDIVGNVRTILLVMTALIIIVSGVGIFVSIYNSMSDRRREIAIMRALGAQRVTVFSIILLESILLCFGGGVLGVLLGHGLVFFSAPIVEARSGVIIDPFRFEPIELVLLPALIVLASLVGLVPGMTAYRTDVARTLAQ